MRSTSNSLVERKRVYIFDTTLRDGEQSAFCTMYQDEKIKIARQLELLGVDIIEAGFAASRQSDKETIRKICQVIKRPYVCSLSRCKKEDIDSAYESLRDYPKKMIHLFIPTSDVQVFTKMKKDYREIEKMVSESVSYANKLFERIEFSCEDASRTELDVLKKIYGIALDEGATIINIPDTVGQIYPEEYRNLVENITEFVKSKNREAITSVHCHNDLGLSTINSLEGIFAGAEQVECTINGIGERAGNCALQEIVAHEKAKNKFYTNIDSTRIKKISKMIENFTGIERVISPLGRAAFAHKAGIHQHGLIAERTTYEILRAEDFGMKTEIVIGPHSGIHGVMAKAKELQIEITKEIAERVLQKVSEKVSKRQQKMFSNRDIVRFINQLK